LCLASGTYFVKAAPFGTQIGYCKEYSLAVSLLGDAYEPDDEEPKCIDEREPQQHNFYPDGDQDFVEFLAKPADGGERWYGVFTSDLAAGVDTAITVTMGSYDPWYNDDYDPGSGNFASTVCLSTTEQYTAVVAITNLGQFAPTSSYTVTVVEGPFIETIPDSFTLNFVEGGAPSPATYAISVTVPGGGNLWWQALESTAWLDIGPVIGKTPSTINMIITGTTTMSNGFYQGNITISPQEPLCDGSPNFQIPVNLVIVPASSSALEGGTWFIPGWARPTPSLQTMYERTGIFLPLRWKEWNGLRRFRP